MRKVESTNAWRELFSHVCQRASKAIKNPTFVISFGVIAILGSIGVWLPKLLNHEVTLFRAESLLTYGVSICASVIAGIILDEESPKSMKMLFLLVLVVSSIMLISGYISTSDNEKAIVSVIGVFLVISTWFLANANDEKYDEMQTPTSPLGGASPSQNKLSGEGL